MIQQGTQWIVMQFGYFGNKASTDDAGFIEFAKKLLPRYLPAYQCCSADKQPSSVSLSCPPTATQ